MDCVKWIGFVLMLAASGFALAQDVRPETFGASGNGTHNDRAAFQGAFDALKAAGGGRIVLDGGSIYYLGELGASMQAAIDITALRNVVVEGNGAELVVKTTAVVTTEIFNLTNPTNVRIQNLRLRDTGADMNVNWRGAVGVRLLAVDGSQDVTPGGIVLDNVQGNHLLTMVQCAGDTSYRLAGVAVRDCSASDCYYGINCQNNGDGLRVSGFRADNVRRPYFVYGIEDHDVELSIHHDGVSRGASAACIVGDLGSRNSRGVKLAVRFFGNTSKYLVGCNLEHQRPAGASPGLISDVSATVDVFAPSAMVPVMFRSYLVSGGTYTEQPTTLNRTDRVTIAGNLATSAPSPIVYISRGP